MKIDENRLKPRKIDNNLRGGSFIVVFFIRFSTFRSKAWICFKTSSSTSLHSLLKQRVQKDRKITVKILIFWVKSLSSNRFVLKLPWVCDIMPNYLTCSNFHFTECRIVAPNPFWPSNNILLLIRTRLKMFFSVWPREIGLCSNSKVLRNYRVVQTF